MSKLQKKIMIFIIVLAFLTPLGIVLPMVFNAGDAWGEWSAETVKELIGYVPEGLQKYSTTYSAPLSDYTLNPNDASVKNQSVYYIFSGIFGAAVTLIVTIMISKFIVRK